MRKSLVIVLVLTALGVGGWYLQSSGSSAGATEITVYKTPWCGCCGNWVSHLRDNGFSVTVKEREDLDPIKRKHGVPENLGSCHTATVEGYTVEGHVPAREIQRMLAERPKARGLAVPGMPTGSPGMESNDPPDRYEVILFDDSGKGGVYARY